MGNYCKFSLRIAGKKADVEKVCVFINEHTYESPVTSIPLDPEFEENSEYETDFYVEGGVKNSICSAWNMDKFKPSSIFTDTSGVTSDMMKEIYANIENRRINGPSLLDIKGDYNIEIFSEEVANGFQEHYIIKGGEVILDDCREFYNYYEDDDETKSFIDGGYSEWKLDFDTTKDIPRWDHETRD